MEVVVPTRELEIVLRRIKSIEPNWEVLYPGEEPSAIKFVQGSLEIRIYLHREPVNPLARPSTSVRIWYKDGEDIEFSRFYYSGEDYDYLLEYFNKKTKSARERYEQEQRRIQEAKPKTLSEREKFESYFGESGQEPKKEQEEMSGPGPIQVSGLIEAFFGGVLPWVALAAILGFLTKRCP